MSKFKTILTVAAMAALVSPVAVYANQGSTISMPQHTWTGTVSSVSGNSITLQAKNKTFTVDATNAKIVKKFGASMQISDLQTNDKISVRGTVSGSTITATLIRDMSLQARDGTLSGSISSLGTGSFSLVTSGNGTQTVNLSSSTVVQKNKVNVGQSGLAVGERVRVAGVWDQANHQISANTVVIVVQTRNVSISGTLQSETGSTLSVSSAKGVTYSIDASHAKLLNLHRGQVQITDMKTGDRVQVRGSHDTGSTTIAASTVRDTSLKN